MQSLYKLPARVSISYADERGRTLTFQGEIVDLAPSGRSLKMKFSGIDGGDFFVRADRCHAIACRETGEVFDDIDGYLYELWASARSGNDGTVPLGEAIDLIPVENVGPLTSRALAIEFRSWDAFISSLFSQAPDLLLQRLLRVPGVGPATATALYEWSMMDEAAEWVNAFNRRFAVAPYDVEQRASLPLHGLRIVFTGTLENMGRSEAKARAEALGATVGASVSDSTHVLVVGEGPGAKLKQAQTKGIQIIDEARYLELIGVLNPA
ncbi:BRCT domain-containing protein [Rhodocista pekingensis]|uniref:BRCT domain-containing protein n=1 Tax=Rhodocista pekingensis TaxID=201185 RepID=A0ABW2L205_9PROT